MESLAFVALAPLAAVLMVTVAGVAWRRRGAPGGWALVAFSVAEAGWLACDALSLFATTPAATLALARASFVWSPLLGVAWVAFVLDYTGRLSRPARRGVVALGAWCLAFGAMALANDAHRLVWSAWQTVPSGPFLAARYTLGPLAWAQTALMWTTTSASLVVIWRAYTGPSSRLLSRWIVAGALAPLGLNVLQLVGLGPAETDFTPIAMGVSSAAFALGLARYRFLNLRPVARAALVDNLGDGVLVLDTRGHVVDVNPAFRGAFGDVALEAPLRDAALAHAIATGPETTLYVGGGADARTFEACVSTLTDRLGGPTGRLVVLHDVTRRRAEQATLHRINAELYGANAELQARNEELDAFAHTVAHDLKNSIHGIAGWADVLRSDGPDLPAEDHRALAGEVVRSALKMATVVDELLLLAGVRQGAVEPRPVEMGAVVAGALARVRSRYPLEVVLPAAWPAALGHAPWLEEVWANYLSNAAKYGGPAVTLGADAAGGQVRFWVHDDGAGLADEAQQQLFVPFSRVGTLSVEGHGLGLSIVRRIAERLGGMCGVQSAPGAGTRFWFSLPAVRPEAPAWTPLVAQDTLDAA